MDNKNNKRDDFSFVNGHFCVFFQVCACSKLIKGHFLYDLCLNVTVHFSGYFGAHH
jgi:hypothetical protein